MTDRETGDLIDVGTTRRRPTAVQRRYVEARDRQCVFIGCRAPASRCDIDHNPTWEETHRTRVDDLAAACPHDHRSIRHNGWSYRRLPDGAIVWRSRLGHTYRVESPHRKEKAETIGEGDDEPP